MPASRAHSARRVAAAIVVAAAAMLAPAATAAGPGACWGAAARDRSQPCHDPRLRLAVVPSPADAERAPSAPCSEVERQGAVQLCGFGTAPAPGVPAVALVGDSHAAHWRAALDVVAKAEGWTGRSIVHSACPLSKATRRLVQPDLASCLRWNREVLAWFRRHPEVRTVFVSALSGGRGVLARRRQDEFRARVRGYLRVWRALPRSVEHIVVIRDSPKVHADTLGCVQRAMKARVPAGPACSVSRRGRLDRDAEVAAARHLHSRRVQVVDLTRYFCGARRCFPVVGGVLAFRDSHHLTPAFVATLGPYLLRRVQRLMTAW